MTRSERRPAFRWLLGALGLVLTCAPACTTAPTVPAAPRPAQSTATSPRHQAPPDTRRAAITALLHRRAMAVRTGDRAAYLGTIDPRATTAFRAAQRREFDNLRAIPLGHWDYTLDPAVSAPTGGVRVRADALWAPAVELRYAIAGIDPEPVGKPLAYLFARRGRHWYLNSDTALRAHTWRGPWDFGRCVVLRTGRGLVLTHPDRLPAARRIAAELDAAVSTVDSVWRAPWTRRVAVLVPSGQAELREQIGDSPPPEAVAAISTAASSDVHTHVASGQRVVFNPAGVDALPDLAVRILLRHEITHVAARAYTVDGLPEWTAEGFADYVGYRDSGLPIARAAPELAEAVRLHGLPAGPPADAEFAGPTLRLAYQQAWTFMRYVAARYGEPTMVALYRTIAARGRSTPAERAADVRSATGMPLAALITGWRRYLSEGLR